MKSPRFKPLRAAFLLSILALVAGCGGGGGGDEEDAKATIDKAFSTSIESANIALSAEVQVDGVAQLQDPVTVKLSGPFQSNGNTKLPGFDWDASFSGGGQSVSGGAWNNPLKARWLGIVNGVGIHGTGAPGSIGSRASHGCIRMTVPDVIDLFGRVDVGTPVLIAP